MLNTNHRAVPVYYTKLYQKYVKFIKEPFSENRITEYFQVFEKKDRLNFTEYKCGKKSVFFYGEFNNYEISTNSNKYILPYPSNLENFISDCYRCDIELIWKPVVLDMFDISDVICIDDYQKYTNEVLSILGKSLT